MNFLEAYKQLNDRQKEAVDTTDGPLLVLAGPGTGKTQILSARVAKILDSTDALPQNILCMTFTESGALNMRERLSSMIGSAAYDVKISTYHSFGSDIITSYPEYFETLAVDRSDDIRLERPIDELSQIQILTNIVNHLPFDNLMLGARYYVRSLASTIGELKQELISPDKLRVIARSNIRQIADMQPSIDTIVNDKNGISRKKIVYLEQYAALFNSLAKQNGELASKAYVELCQAIKQNQESNSSKPLTSWKNKWLHKNNLDRFTLTKERDSQKLFALANIYADYQTALAKLSAYDFNDMILQSINAIESNDELRFSLQEKYQYILLDEFQDTNPAQFKLVNLIADHAVHEGRPNIMAVGDDDQAIYAFQGANVGNMYEFTSRFRDVSVINLTKNYRSHADIIHSAHNISNQIETRLHHNLSGVSKVLEAQSSHLPKSATIERHELNSTAAEYHWVSQKIHDLIKSGESPEQIAVLSPKHKLLEQLVPFLKKDEVEVSYDKRENILDTPLVQSLKLMSELLVALETDNKRLANKLFPAVLSLEFWNIPVQQIWKTNWGYRQDSNSGTWAEAAIENEFLAQPTTLLLALSLEVKFKPLEDILDALTGNIGVNVGGGTVLTSSLKHYYFNDKTKTKSPLKYYEAISHLSVIRSKLRDYQVSQSEKMTVKDFLEFFVMYEQAEQSLINSHPIAQSESAVQLMTAYKAKGLEFNHVFILSAHDDVWGSKARGGSNKLTLPENLRHIRHAGEGEDGLKRLLFVAITRAKHGLYISSHSNKDNGKTNEPVKYLEESEGVTKVLPEQFQDVASSNFDKTMLAEHIDTLWQSRHVDIKTDLKSLLSHRLERYQMSPTHLNSFIDTVYGGPEVFLLNTILRFPQAPSLDGEYGTAIHNTLEWYQNQLNKNSLTTPGDAVEFFKKHLQQRYISAADISFIEEKGSNTILKYIAARSDMFNRNAKSEVNFKSEGVLIGEAHMSGKIDRLEINKESKTIAIADYKTGGSFSKWRLGSSMKHIKYEQQLYIYKFLIEKSHSFKGYAVESARLEFVEPDAESGLIADPLFVEFNDKKEIEIKGLIEAVWQKIKTLDLPDIAAYGSSAKGSLVFQADLIAELLQKP